MYRVALVGHSNLPEIPIWGGVRVELFKERGAELLDLVQRRRFSGALYATHWDCVVLFLGGNDLARCRSPYVMYWRFSDAFDVHDYDRLMVTDLEPHLYNRELALRHGITTEQYTPLANVIDKKLRRRARRDRQTIQLIHVPSGYMVGSREGIHLSPSGEQKLIEKYKKVINAYRSERNQ